MSQRLISLNQFCRDYHVSRATVYRKLSTGELRAVKVGARTCVPVEEAERWFTSLATYQPGIMPANSNHP